MGVLKRLLPPQAQLVLAGAKFWRSNHIGKRLLAGRRARREVKRAARRREAEGAATEAQFQFDDNEEDTMLGQICLALLARLAPAASALLASYGIHVSEGTSTTVTIGLAVGVYLVVHGVQLARELIAKHRAKSQ